MKHPVLYKKTATGAIQVWWIHQEGDSYWMNSGQEDGIITASRPTRAEPKNVGRANETTAEEQAVLEIRSAYEKKLNQGGYHESRDTIDKAKYFKPMLAHKFESADFRQDIFSQPKLDGVRCVATADGLWSRTGKPILSCPHVMDALVPFFQENPDAIFDGELYADKLSDDFNKIISLVRKSKPTSRDLAESAAVVEYHVYDMPSVDDLFRQRSWVLGSALGYLNHPSLKLVSTVQVENVSMLDSLCQAYIERGYEGQIIRLNGPYENKRSKYLLKRKEFQDQEFRIVQICEGIGNRSGMAGFIVYELGDGRTFKSGIKGSHDYCRTLLDNAELYVGGEGTVRFFNLTPGGIPRFPITVALYPGGRDI